MSATGVGQPDGAAPREGLAPLPALGPAAAAVRAAEATVARERRPLLLVVGQAPPVAEHALVRQAVDVVALGPTDAVAWLSRHSPDVVLVDNRVACGSWRTPVLDAFALARAATGERASLLLCTCDRNGEVVVEDPFDDVLPATAGPAELVARVRTAVRFRDYAAELARKTGELEALYARVEAMARRMADDLRLATKVQRSLLPPPWQHARLDVAREFIPVREIGGDYYDTIRLGPDRLAFAVGDVMGKGVAAALLAASLRAAVRAQIQTSEPARSDVLVSRVNRLFHEVSPEGLFASLFFGVLDLDQGEIEYVNAGHHPPFVVRPDGAVTDLVEGGTVLGLLEDAVYHRGRQSLAADDVLVYYSDGVIDRQNAEAELYGAERLKDAARQCRGDSARIILYTLLGEVQGWSGGRPADDDLTLAVSKLR